MESFLLQFPSFFGLHLKRSSLIGRPPHPAVGVQRVQPLTPKPQLRIPHRRRRAPPAMAATTSDDVAPPTASGYLDPSYWFAPSFPSPIASLLSRHTERRARRSDPRRLPRAGTSGSRRRSTTSGSRTSPTSAISSRRSSPRPSRCVLPCSPLPLSPAFPKSCRVVHWYQST
jgi:hypothetical protein